MEIKTQNIFMSEKGNVLWFILIAVTLLGLLTMVMSRGGSSTDQTGDFEQLRVQASDILRFAKSMETAVQEMELRGVSENDISFENSISTTDYTNANCDDASDRNYPACKVFGFGGAGLSYKAPNARWLDSSHSAEDYYGDWLFTGDVCILTSLDSTAADCNTNYPRNSELTLILPYVSLELCRHINSYVDAPTSTGNPPQDDAGAWPVTDPHFVGVFGAGGRTLTDSPIADLRAVSTGCFEGDVHPAAGTYHFYHVLKAR